MKLWSFGSTLLLIEKCMCSSHNTIVAKACGLLVKKPWIKSLERSFNIHTYMSTTPISIRHSPFSKKTPRNETNEIMATLLVILAHTAHKAELHVRLFGDGGSVVAVVQVSGITSAVTVYAIFAPWHAILLLLLAFQYKWAAIHKMMMTVTNNKKQVHRMPNSVYHIW